MNRHPITTPAQEKNFVRGLAGIQEIFGCGKSKAVELKRDVISDAVKNFGGLIVTDRRKAIELFFSYNPKHK